MSVRHSLRLRFALTFALVGAILVLIHAVAILQLNRHQEAQLIDQIVSDEMESLLQQYERIGSIDGPPYRKLQRFDVRADTQALSLRKWFRASWLVHGYATRGPDEQRQLPEELRDLEPGFHDVTSGADRYRVEVREIGSMRFYLAYSVSLHEERARAFTVALVLGAAFTALVTALIGLWASGWLTRHVVDLARRVRELDSRTGESRLERFYPEREVAELAAAFE
ncbi:MAG TPA: hypothetical protein PKH90_14070, partial [Candidatus Desulfobacillus denitrificans]|nr:hypothetical protein [Candidatus Desulfobacillus denitrificans]